MPIATVAPVIECKVCGFDARFFGAVDAAKSCMDLGVAAGQPLLLPLTGVQIPYHRCTNCAFLFSSAFDHWSAEDFSREIYNADYIKVDPEFASIRPHSRAELLAYLLAPRRGAMRLLDYGGGAGVFARRMIELGFDAASYDPHFKGDLEPRLGEKFEMIHCSEVIEHTPDPRDFARDLVRFLAADGAIYMSTATQPAEIASVGLSWWYAAPRNGHISLFTREALGLVWQEQGLQFGSFDENHQIAWRGAPACYSCLVKG